MGSLKSLKPLTDVPPESRFKSVSMGKMSQVMKALMLNTLTWLVPTLLLLMIQNCGLALLTTGMNIWVTSLSDFFIRLGSMPLIHFQTINVKSASKIKARSKEFCLHQLCLADPQGSGTLFQGKYWSLWWVTNVSCYELNLFVFRISLFSLC